MPVISSPIRSPIRSPIYSPLTGKWGSTGYTFVNAEAAALVARFTTPATEARKPLIDNLFTALKSIGLAKFDALYVLAAETSQAARQNWIANRYNISASNGPTFTADRGYAGDGTTSFLNTNFNPGTATTPNISQNSAHQGIWNRTVRAANATALCGIESGTYGLSIYPRFTADVLFARTGDKGTSVATTGSDGFLLGSRTGAAGRDTYRNGASLGNTVVASVALSVNANCFIGGFSTAVGALSAGSTDQVAAYSVGSGLTSGEVLSYYTAFNTYLQAVGAA